MAIEISVSYDFFSSTVVDSINVSDFRPLGVNLVFEISQRKDNIATIKLDLKLSPSFKHILHIGD